jgi:DNA repair photolyase
MTLNPYAGCPVGCAYCFVPFMPHKQLEDRTWGSYVEVKEGAAELLDAELSRLRKPTTVFMSTGTDPYQPVEERFKITRSILEVFKRHPKHTLSILTKQSLVERDADLLERLPRARVGMSISTIDDRLSAIIEPWAPVTSERLAVIGRLARRGIITYLLWAPALVPVPMTEGFVRRSVEAIAGTGARALALDSLNYRLRQQEGFYRRLAREHHAPAREAQLGIIRAEADRRGLGSRAEITEATPLDEMTPMLPFF